MKKYKVVLSDDIYYNIEVKANNESEAIKKAEKLWHEGKVEGKCLDHLILYTEKIKQC
jgi:hypothetical protein